MLLQTPIQFLAKPQLVFNKLIGIPLLLGHNTFLIRRIKGNSGIGFL